MTVSTETFWNLSTGNGATRAFGFTFPVTSTSDVVVLLDGAVANNYVTTLTDIDNPAGGGTVTFDLTFEPGNGVEVLRIRRLEYLQATELGTAFNRDVVEQTIDRVVMLTQQVKRTALRVSDTRLADGFDGEISAALTPGYNLVVNGDGDGFTLEPISSNVGAWASLTPSANAQSLVTAANYAAMRTLLDLEAGTDFYSISAADAAIAAVISDTAYNATTWNGVTTIAPSKNAVRDQFEALSAVYQPLDSDLTTWAGITPGANVGTFLATPSSANLAAAVTDESGSGALVFATSPSLVTVLVGSTVSATAPIRATNTTDVNVSLAAIFETNRATPTVSDALYIDYKLSDSAGNQDTFYRMYVYATAITSASEAGMVRHSLVSAGSIVNVMDMGPTYLRPTTNNGVSLGTATVGWSDIFLGDGAVINFNNGDVTLTHATDALAMAGGAFSVSQGAANTTPSGTFVNTNDAASVRGLRIEGDRATPANNDEVYASFFLSDTAGNQDEFVRLIGRAATATSGAETGSLRVQLMTSGTLSTRLVLLPTALQSNADDTVSLGVAGTGFSDLFLASGGVINWNSGDITLTHSTDKLTLAGGQLIIPDGSVSAPGIAFTGAAGTGLYWVSNEFAFANAGGLYFYIGTGRIHSVIPHWGASGSAAAPGWSFHADSNSGFYSIGADNLGVSVAGAKVLDISTTGLDITGSLKSRTRVSSETGGTLTVASSNATVLLATAPTIAASVHTAGDEILLVNNTGSSMTITQGAGGTQRKAGTATTGNLTLPAYGAAPIYFSTATAWFVSGVS